VTLPNSLGEPDESVLLEVWSDTARAAAAAARRRRRIIKRLGRIRTRAMNKLLDQINQDKDMNRGNGISKAAAKHWTTANDISGLINKLKDAPSATASRPLLSRLSKKLKRMF